MDKRIEENVMSDALRSTGRGVGKTLAGAGKLSGRALKAGSVWAWKKGKQEAKKYRRRETRRQLLNKIEDLKRKGDKDSLKLARRMLDIKTQD